MAKSTGIASCGIAVLRITVGAIFLTHGWQKIYTLGFHGVAGFFASIGIPLPLFAAIVVTLVEFLGGIALILGLATRWASLLLAFDMLGAIYFVHWKNGFYMSHSGYEYALSLLAACIALALNGAGALGIDTLL